MATNKANRSIHLAQPDPAKLMLVRAHTYRSLAEMNTGLEQAIQGLETLKRINFLSSDSIKGIHHLLSRIRAQANHEIMVILAARENANAEHFREAESTGS